MGGFIMTSRQQLLVRILIYIIMAYLFSGMEGLIFGNVDNGVMLLCAATGLEIDRYLNRGGCYGVLIGAGLGNTISDTAGAILDPSMHGAILGITIGCLMPLIFIPLIAKYTRSIKS